MLKALVESEIKDKSPSLSDLRTVAFCLVGFAGFFRFSKLGLLRACNVTFCPWYVSIFLESLKTDQFRDGAWIAIARTGRLTCPVEALERYIAAANIGLAEDTFAPSPRVSSLERKGSTPRD